MSTARQESDRQVSELEAHAAERGYRVVEVCRERVSGAADQDSRQGLARVLDLARAGDIRKVLVHEVSRVARKNSVAHAFIEELEGLGVSLYWHAQRVETLLPSGKRNPAAAIMFSLLAEMARAEREQLRERVLSGLAEARRKGRRLGRPPGTAMTGEAILAKHAVVLRALRRGFSIRAAAAVGGVARGTAEKVRRIAVAAGKLAMAA